MEKGIIICIIIYTLFITSTIGIIKCKKQGEHYCKSDLTKLIEDTITSGPKTRWGIHAVGLKNNQWEVLYNKDAEYYFTPASNNKLLTCSAAYLHFGVDYTFKTKLLKQTHNHCLKVTGQFDLTSDQLVTMIQKNGVTNLILDTQSFFGKNTPAFIGGWEWGDLPYYYSALPTSSHMDNNLISMIVSYDQGNISVRFPYAKVGIPVDTTQVTYDETREQGNIQTSFQLGKKELILSGIVGRKPIETYATIIQPDEHMKNTLLEYVNEVKFGVCEENAKVVDTLASDPLVNLMNHTLLVSDNTWTELFLRHLGAEQLQNENAHTTGLSIIKTILGQQGVPTDLFYQADGSGLARQNRISPASLTALLKIMPDAFSTILPQSGKSGTLAHRFTKYPQGIIKAKTGTLTGVVTLSGYALNKDYDKVVFSIMSNNAVASSATIREVMDKMAIIFPYLDPSC